MFLVALALAAIDPPPPRPMAVEVARDTISDAVKASATILDAGQRLTLACDPQDFGGIRVSFTSSRWLARPSFVTRERPMVYRFDSDQPERQVWVMRDRGAFFGGRDRVGRFLRGLITAEQLVIRTRDVEDHPVDLTFRISGAYPAVRELLEACGESELRRRLYGPA